LFLQPLGYGYIFALDLSVEHSRYRDCRGVHTI
jgi:hypothetical protein